MKKIISFLIATAIILLNFVLIGCAKETKLGYFQEQRIKRDYIEQFSVQNKSVSEVVLDYYGGSYYGYEIVMLDAECHDPEERTEIIGDTSITYYDSNQLYAWKNGQFFTLDELYLSKVFSIDLVADIANEYNISIHNFSDVCDKHDFYYAPIDNYVNPMEFTKKLKNELCVRVDKKLSHLDSSELLKYLGYDYFSEISNSCQIKNGDTKLTVTICGNGIFDIVDAINHLATKPGIKGIGVSYVLEFEDMLFSPNDTFYGSEQWAINAIELEKIWDFSVGASSIGIGVADTGVIVHDDIQNNLVAGKDFYNNSTNTSDDVFNHGTFIAGILGAVGNNNQGIVGVNWRVSIVPLQVINAVDGAGYNDMYNYRFNSENLVQALEYVNENDDIEIKVVNISICVDAQSDQLLGEIQNYNGLIVCAAGNDGINLDNSDNIYPQRYNSLVDNMLVVGAIDENDNRSIWPNNKSSNYGENTVDIYAPGSNIYSTYGANLYGMNCGTSFSAPYVSGVAGLLLSINPNLTGAQLKECILGGADEINIEVPSGLLGMGTETQTVKKLNAWGAFMYMMENYAPEHIVSQTATQITLNTDRSSLYYFEKKPTVRIDIPFDEVFTFTLSGVGSSVDVTLYDSEMNEIEINKTWQNSQWTVTFTEELSQGIYYLTGNYNNVSGGNTLSLSISHEHTYTDWESISNTQHIEACECGIYGTSTGEHVTRASEVVNGKAYCIDCGYLVTGIGGYIPIIHNNIPKVSLNGSYILPNGVIVLVDEDVEAYLNGTLVFYDRDKLPETQ